MTSRLFIPIIISLSCVFGAVLARAAEPVARIQGLLLNADEMFRDTEADTVELSGHVQIVSQERHVQADRAHISLRARQVELTGNVRLTTPTATISGERILLDYESNTGAIYNGSVQSGPISFEGALIQKTGPDDYFVVDADYTSCTNCPATWSFHGSTIRAELGGYAYIKNSWFRIGDVSVFWLPYLVVPLKSDRQSGLLTPGFEHSDGGLALSQPYFWAISRSTDATITAKNYELRGPKGLGEYRYALPGENNGGEFDGAIMRDRLFGSKLAQNPFHRADTGNGVDRWYMHYTHYAELDSGWVHRMSVNNASDLRYPQDFPLEMTNLGDTAMESRVSMTKNTESGHFSVDSSYYKNMLAGDPTAGNEDSVHRLPEFRYAQVPQAIPGTPLFYNLNFDYTNFTRSGPGYDNVTGMTDPNGATAYPVDNTCIGSSNNPASFGNDPHCVRRDDIYSARTVQGQSGSILRTGQRLIFEPSVSLPFSVGDYADVLPAVSFNETNYSFPVGQEPNYSSRYVRVDLDTRTRFSHVYGDLNDVHGTRYKHEIRPEIRYRGMPYLDRQNNAFFGNSASAQSTTQITTGLTDADLAYPGGIQFDYNDRIYDKNRISYMLTNTITEKKWVNEKPVYNQLALVQLAQTYDAEIDASSDVNKEPWSDISALVDLRLEHWQSNSQLNYFPYQKVWKSASYLRYKDDLGRFIQVGLNLDPKVVAGQPANFESRTEDWIYGAGLISRHFNFMGLITADATKNSTRDPLRNPAKSWAYIVQYKPPGDCWLISLTHTQLVGSSENIQLGFEFNFDGTPKKPLGPEELSRFSF